MIDCYVVFGYFVVYLKLLQIYVMFGCQEGIVIDYCVIDLVLEVFLVGLEVFVVEGGVGVNVILLYKEIVFLVCIMLIVWVCCVGLVNMLLCKGDCWYGDIIDGIGLVCDLIDCYGLDLCGCCVLMIGVGGLVCSVVLVLLDVGIIELVVVNCMLECVDELIDVMGELGCVISCYWEDLCELGDFELIVNVILVGCDCDVEFKLLLLLVNLMIIVVDLNYGEVVIVFLVWVCVVQCCNIVDGLGMLVEQVVESFLQWYGVCLQIDEVYQVLCQGLVVLVGED